jgi:hypothetical protein
MRTHRLRANANHRRRAARIQKLPRLKSRPQLIGNYDDGQAYSTNTFGLVSSTSIRITSCANLPCESSHTQSPWINSELHRFVALAGGTRYELIHTADDRSAIGNRGRRPRGGTATKLSITSANSLVGGVAWPFGYFCFAAWSVGEGSVVEGPVEPLNSA